MHSHVHIHTHAPSYEGFLTNPYPSQLCNAHCRAMLGLNWKVLKSKIGTISYMKPYTLPSAALSQSSCHSIIYDIHSSKSVINNILRNKERDVSIINISY
jgi:hypothetical protein